MLPLIPKGYFISPIKSLSARKLINSEPVILVKNGKIVDGNLQKTV